jgi:pimeloyl-ACP methyl ester carboxylesterase
MRVRVLGAMERPTVTAAGVELAYDERGGGPATVVVHGMGARAPAVDAGGRVVTYDRRGYGDSEAPEPYVRTTVGEQAEDLACVIERLGLAPAVLVGFDLGALVVLDVLFRHAALARAAILVDPPTYMFVAEATEALSEERAALEDAVRAGGPLAGMEWWLEARGRDGFDSTRDALAFFADYGAIATLTVSHGALLAIRVPVAVVSSEAARPHDVAAADALLDALAEGRAAGSVDEALRAIAR